MKGNNCALCNWLCEDPLCQLSDMDISIIIKGLSSGKFIRILPAAEREECGLGEWKILQPH